MRGTVTILGIALAATVSAWTAPATAQSTSATGTIEGQVRLDLPSARRWASRYPTGGSATARQHDVPVVIYLDGNLPAAAAGEAADIVQAEGRFEPAGLAVTAGTTVRFPNDDTFYHNVYSYSRPRFDLGRYPQGESREVVLDVPGLVEVYCEVHEFMRAVVVVTDHGFHAVVGPDGSFRLTGVPAGRYTLVAFHPDIGVREVDVQLRAGGTARVDVEMIG